MTKNGNKKKDVGANQTNNDEIQKSTRKWLVMIGNVMLIRTLKTMQSRYCGDFSIWG
jgi:hypothetical protein